MPEAYIVDAIRTPVGRKKGSLSGVHPADLGAHVLRAIVERNDFDASAVEDVVFGCVDTIGPQAGDIARTCWLAAGLPEEVPGTTVDRQCGSSQQSVHFAAQAVMAGVQDIVIAAGVENMTRVPMGITAQQGPGLPFGAKMLERYANGLVPQGISAEMIAEKWGISREELDQLSLESHRRAAQATEEGRFEGQIIPVDVTRDDGTVETVTRDEGIRWDTTLEKLASLQPAFQADGKVTAGNSSQISDGAVAILVMAEDKAEELGLTPKARVHTMTMAGVDPIMMLTGPIPATEKALERSGLSIDDIDLFEVNEAFASVTVAWRMEYGGTDPMGLWDRTNVNGGAIAIGHPLGASGGRLMTSLVWELERTGGRYGVQTMCEGGGMANATIIERI